MGEPRDGAQVLDHLERPYFPPGQPSPGPASLRTPMTRRSIVFWPTPGDPHDELRPSCLARWPSPPGWPPWASCRPPPQHGSRRRVHAAMAHGLRHIIHVWSAQSTTVREGPWRKHRPAGASLAFDGLTVEMICDNNISHPRCAAAVKAVGTARLCAVSRRHQRACLPKVPASHGPT